MLAQQPVYLRLSPERFERVHELLSNPDPPSVWREFEQELTSVLSPCEYVALQIALLRRSRLVVIVE